MFSTPLASTAMVRPPAARAPRWAAASMPRARPLMTVSPARASPPASRSACRRPYWVPCRVPTMPIGQGVVRFHLAADEEHAGRIVNLPQRPRIGGVGLGENVDAVLPAQGDFGLHVDLVVGAGDLVREFRADALHGPQFAGRRRQHRPGRAEPLQQPLADRRPHAGNQAEPEGVEQFVAAAPRRAGSAVVMEPSDVVFEAAGLSGQSRP